MNKYLLFIFLGSLFLFQCKKTPTFSPIPSNAHNAINANELSQNQKREWHFKDIIDDTIPGISLEKAYNTIINETKGDEVIVAVIDMGIDINHEDLEKSIWVNSDEIPNNNLDDDNNGYIDDTNGWNFLGNSKGESAKFVNYEYTRILKKYRRFFESMDLQTISKSDSTNYLTYLRAKTFYDNRMKFALDDTTYINMVQNAKNTAYDTIYKHYKINRLTLGNLDSLKNLNVNNSILQIEIIKMTNFLKYGYTDKYISNYKLKAVERINKLLNLEYNDRFITGDNQDDLNDIKYGNNVVNANVGFFNHGTLIAGVIGADRNNKVGIKGFSNKIKIMPLSISAFGDEHDKDIALAIKYAVDNGAKVINMSFGKEFSLQKEWVFEAFKYAENNDVLIVSSAGNSNYDLNQYNDYFPNDNLENGKEVSSNFLLIGSSTYNLNEELFSPFSNYGNIDVDILAPGGGFLTTSANLEKYEDTPVGTSISSAIVSGVAALIYSHYPGLAASEVKRIILESGIEYNIPVKLNSETNKSKRIAINKLSKSGKIVNAYNALIMAHNISKR